jgi:hypothetical protein
MLVTELQTSPHVNVAHTRRLSATRGKFFLPKKCTTLEGCSTLLVVVLSRDSSIEVEQQAVLLQLLNLVPLALHRIEDARCRLCDGLPPDDSEGQFPSGSGQQHGRAVKTTRAVQKV